MKRGWWVTIPVDLLALTCDGCALPYFIAETLEPENFWWPLFTRSSGEQIPPGRVEVNGGLFELRDNPFHPFAVHPQIAAAGAGGRGESGILPASLFHQEFHVIDEPKRGRW